MRKLTEQKLRAVIREEIISENIIKNFIDGFRKEYNKWKSAFHRAIHVHPMTKGSAYTNVGREFTAEVIVHLFVYLSVPFYGLIMLGPTLYKKYKKRKAEIEKDKQLSSEEYQKKLVEIAAELYSELPTGKKRYIQGLINKMENKETKYARELDDYLKRQLGK